jgi:hypothetical protein
LKIKEPESKAQEVLEKNGAKKQNGEYNQDGCQA